MTLPSTNAVLPIFSCTMRKEFHLILYCPRSSAFVFVCSVDSSNSYLLLISPTLFFSNICLAELGPSFTAEDLWNICEISMKYLWNIWKIFMKYLWNICVMFVKYLWNISDIFVKLYNFFQYVYHRGGSIIQHRKLYS